jgi:hypothetical protein
MRAERGLSRVPGGSSTEGRTEPARLCGTLEILRDARIRNASFRRLQARAVGTRGAVPRGLPRALRGQKRDDYAAEALT